MPRKEQVYATFQPNKHISLRYCENETDPKYKKARKINYLRQKLLSLYINSLISQASTWQLDILGIYLQLRHFSTLTYSTNDEWRN